jgi:hypothetical protein
LRQDEALAVRRACGFSFADGAVMGPIATPDRFKFPRLPVEVLLAAGANTTY